VAEFLSDLGDLLSAPGMSFAGVDETSAATSQSKVRTFLRSLWASWTEEYFAYAKSLLRARARIGLYDAPPGQEDDFLEDRMDFGEYVVFED